MIVVLSFQHHLAEVQLEMNGIKYPTCCGEMMRLCGDTGKFLELECVRCGDMVYLKKSTMQKPRMIDD